MLFRKLWRTMGLYKAQFISMMIMITLGIGIFVGFNMEWVSIRENTETFFEQSGYADYRILSDKGFSEEDCRKIQALDEVSAAARYISVNADVKERDGDSVALSVTEDANVSGMVMIEGKEYDSESIDGIWLSDRYADANDIRIGDTLTLVYKGFEIKGSVVGFIKAGEHMICVRDESQLMPDYSTYGFAYISPAMYEKNIGAVFYPQINVISDAEKKEFSDVVNQALDATALILTKDDTASYAQANGEVEEGKTMGAVLPVLFLLIAVLTMVTTMHRLAVREKTQIGTLKALGFRDRTIIFHYSSYALMIGLVGSLVGIALGYGIAWYIMNPNGMMGTYLDMPEWKLYLPWFCYVVIFSVIALLTLIGFLSVRQMLKGSAAESLRPYIPKKMKPLLLERTGIFQRLSFGTRWNLRDIMRHKSRTAMSLVGIVGCMAIIICAFGMRDTMKAFLNMYYDGALKYSSRIYISENAEPDKVDALIEKYNGDWSSSVGVSVEDKTVSLDIYNVGHSLVRFPDLYAEYAEIGHDGAYICQRLADRLCVSIGDSFTVSPYGSNQKYNLKVAGVIRSVSENIVISSEYAEKINIPYAIDSIYTETEKANIAASPEIKSIQSKQMIIDSFDTFTDIMDIMIYLLAFGAAILGIVVLYNLGVMSYTERYREMATLKVVGFKDKKIGHLLISQNLWLTLIGSIIGLPLGVLSLDYLLKSLASEYEMKLTIGPLTYIIGVLLTFGVSLIVSIAVAGKNKKIDMVEALKSAE